MSKTTRCQSPRAAFHSAKAFEFPAATSRANPTKIRLRAEPSGDGRDYREIAVRAWRGRKAIADILVGLDQQGNLRLVCTANGEGDGNHAIAVFPELPPEKMVKRNW